MSRPTSSFDDWVDNDFGSIVIGLTNNIHQAMQMLYNLEVASIAANRWNLWRYNRSYTEVRSALKSQWEGITALIKDCRVYGGYVVRLHGNIATLTREEAVDQLKDVATKGEAIANLAKELCGGHDGVIKHYNRHRIEFTDSITQINQSHSIKGWLGAFRHWFNDRPRFVWDVYVLRAIPYKAMTCPPSPITEDNLDPDGRKAMTKFEKSTRNIHQSLFSLSQFLDHQSDACVKYLLVLQDPSSVVEAPEIQQFAKKWELYQNKCMQAVKRIDKICDAIMVHPDGKGNG